MIRYRYQFSGGMCVSCLSHRAAFAAEATPADWEVLTIAFERKVLREDPELTAFLKALAAELGLAWLGYSPRKSPYHGFGKFINKVSDELEQFAELVGADRDSWREDAWIEVEESSIFDDQRCSTPGCANEAHDWEASRWQDVVLHAPMYLTSVFLGALFDWNHGLAREEALRRAPVEAAARSAAAG